MKWNSPGLNIFLSVKVCDLPQTLFPFSDKQKHKTLCLVGHGGNSLWRELSQPINLSQHPFDNYTIKEINRFSKEYLHDDCEILFPNEDYILPLQKIGRLINFSSQSPIGIDICHEFGLWFAYRGVFLTSQNIAIKATVASPSICSSCNETPCLKETNFRLARLSCPIKAEHAYNKDQLDYHQNALGH